MSAPSYSDLWTFSCPRHGGFDVWGEDWSAVPVDARPRAFRKELVFEPEDIRKTRCPRCGQPAHPIGPLEDLT